jgi:hypothetical protein
MESTRVWQQVKEWAHGRTQKYKTRLLKACQGQTLAYSTTTPLTQKKLLGTNKNLSFLGLLANLKQA